ncbi:hypothetical protein CBR_g45932 [Chara braunii]|uniref:Integrase catalytic domain-containing protein n=1 Tax=Chara braunii TaxID=69332 RepID=A0A388LZP3_CHABU|nr:hypothetical protein CBR_g45932 [Chara braunii]|eukprot:GBG87776.1 hypothetical protein CBR_g45932 [Chara braunii]
MRWRPLTPQARLAQTARTRNQAKASVSQEPPRREPEPGRRKEVVEVEDDDDEEEEDERLRREDDQRAEQRARKKGTKGEAEPVIHDEPPKKKKYAVRLEEGFDVEKVIDRLLEGHNDLMTLKEILASAPRLCNELKGRLSRLLLPNVHLGTILPKEAEWAESGTKMDWTCVVCGTVDLMVKGSKCAAMVDTGAEMNIIREADAIRFGLDIDCSDCGILHGASCKAVFCGKPLNVLVEVGKVKVRACFFILPDVDHGILLGRSFLSRTETVMFNKHDGTLIILLCNPACGNYEIITCRNTGPRSIWNRPNPGSFTIEESEGERRRLWEEPEAGERDLQRLNVVTVRDAGGLPNADVLSESCAQRPIILLINLYSEYDQFPVYPPDRPVTAMHTPQGLVHMNVAPQGWTNAVAMVQRAMIRAMQSVSPHITQPYIDDLQGPAMKESDEVSPEVRRFVWKHIQDLEKVLSLLEEHNLTASRAKCRHCMREAIILGIVCNEKGRRPDVKKTDKITEWPVPFHSITDVRSFLVARWLTYIWMFNFELERIPGSKNRADGLSRINWDKQEGEAVENTPPVDGFLDQEEDVRLHINKWSLRVPSCVGYPIWQASKGYERRNVLLLKPFEEEDPWAEGLDQSGSLNSTGNVDEVPESQDDEFEEGEIKEVFRAEEYYGIYLEQGLLLSCEMRLRDASDRAQRMLQRYLVRDGHLFVRREVKNPRRVVCGRNRQIDVVAVLHDGIAGGHRGVQATYARISELYYWDGMMNMVGKLCRSCMPCQERSRLRQGEPLHPRLEREVGAVGHLDLLFMPLGDQGYNYIFDAHENLSGFVDGRAIRTKTGLVLVSCIEEYYLRYPFVREFVMDRGSQFTCQEVQKLLSRYGVAANYTTAAHPQANAPVERGHSTITSLLAKWTEERPNQWPRYLRAAFFVDNITIKRSTKHAPATLWYRRHATFPIESFLKKWRRQDLEINLSFEELLDIRARHIGAIEERIQEASDQVVRSRMDDMARWDQSARVRKVPLAVGDVVLLYDSSLEKQWSRKLDKRWLGPYRIVRVGDFGAYQIEELNGTEWKDWVSGTRLKKVVAREEPGEARPSRGGRKALARREEEPEREPEVEERRAYPEYGLGPVEFHRFTEGGLRRSPAHTREEPPGSAGSLRELETHLDISQWRASPQDEKHEEQVERVPQEKEPQEEVLREEVPREEVPREEVPREEAQGTQRESRQGDGGRRAGKEVIEVGEDTPPQTPVVGLRLGDAPESTRQAEERLRKEEAPFPSSERALSPEGRAGRRREITVVRREALTLIDRHLAAYALEHPDQEEPALAEPCQEPYQPEKEMEAEIPKRVDLRTRERAPTGETAEEKRARRTKRIDEIWQERQRLEAAGELPEHQQERQRSEAAGALPGPRQEPPMGRVILEPEEARAQRQAEKEAFEFRAPTELATLPVAAPDPVVPLAVEEGLPPSSSEPAQGSAEGFMDVLLEAVHTMQEEVSLFSPEQRIEEPLEREIGIEAESAIESRLQRMGTPEYGPGEIEEQPMAVPGETLKKRPQRLDTPEYVPVTGDLRSRLGFWATGSGSRGPVPGMEQQEVVSTAAPGTEQQGIVSTLVGSPSSPPPQPKKKKFKRKVDQLCFYCKRDVHHALDCLEFLEDKAEGKVSEAGGKMYDRQGRIVEKSADGLKAQLYRQNQEELKR